MIARLAVVVMGLCVAVPAWAQEMNPDHARRFVVGKLFGFTCFDGTRGAGRIMSDGSVAGTLQMSGNGPVRYAALPAGTLQVRDQKICASLKGMPFSPCFNLTQTSQHSFRGAISGLGFAYCDFTKRGHGRTKLVRTATHAKPMTLRSSMAE